VLDLIERDISDMARPKSACRRKTPSGARFYFAASKGRFIGRRRHHSRHHVTGRAVIERYRDNLNNGFRPILRTGQRGLPIAEGLADNAGLAGDWNAACKNHRY